MTSVQNTSGQGLLDNCGPVMSQDYMCQSPALRSLYAVPVIEYCSDACS